MRRDIIRKVTAPQPADKSETDPEQRPETRSASRGHWSDFLFVRIDKLWGLVLSIPGARRGVRAVRLLVHGFRGEAISLRASALTYLTLFAMIPLLAVVYSVLDLVGDEESLRNSVQTWLTEQLGIGAGAALETRLQDLTSKASVKALGAIGFLFLLFSIISLLWNIESAFNHIYAVKRPRKLLDRLLKYWSFLTLGPLLLAGSLGLTWRISSLQGIHAAHAQAGHSEILHVFTALSSIAITYAALTLLYKVLPNAYVPIRSAFGAAFVAGTAWEIAKFVFAYASSQMVQVHKIYGPLAVLPIMLTWVYISWMITLGGCRLCFAFEASRKTPAHPLMQGAASREALTARCAIELIRQHRVRKRPVRAAWIARELEVTRRLALECLRALEDSGLVAETRGHRWLPARAAETITLADLRNAARQTMGYPKLEADPLGAPLFRAWREADLAASAVLGENLDRFLADHDQPAEDLAATPRPSEPSASEKLLRRPRPSRA